MRSILKEIKYQDEANQDNSLFNVISFKHGKDLTRFFWADLIYRVYGNRVNNFFCIFIWGEQGSAKSGVGQLIMQNIFPDFSPEQVVFTNEELRMVMNTIEEGKGVLRDEYQKTFGEGSYQLQATIENYTRQLRDRGNSFVYIQPDYTDMKNFHYFIRTIYFDEVNKVVKAGIQNPMTNAYMGYVMFDLKPIWNNDFWMAYKKRKDSFVNVVATNNYDKVDLEQIGKEIMELPEFNRCIKTKSNGDKDLNMGFVKNLVYKKSPNLTTAQNQMLSQEIRFLFDMEKEKYCEVKKDGKEKT